MIVPKERPTIERLNNYYLKLDRFVEYMQKSIQSGCIYCRSNPQELMIYFNEYEVIRCLVQNRGRPAQEVAGLPQLMELFQKKNFIVSAHYLDQNAVYFWGQIGPYKRAKKMENAGSRSFRKLVDKCRTKAFSGFIDAAFNSRDGGVLFFEKGSLMGGSYSWGKGGLSPWEEDYHKLSERFDQERSTLQLCQYAANPVH